MKKRYYNSASLGSSLTGFEDRFGMSSAAFYGSVRDGDLDHVAHIPRFLQHTWASFYLEWRQLTDDDTLGTAVKRELELA